MNRKRIAYELLQVAKELTAASVSRILDDIGDIYTDLDHKLDWRTLNKEERKAFQKDFAAAFNKTKELKQWGRNFETALIELGDMDADGEDLEGDHDVKPADLQSDHKLLMGVLTKHKIQDRMLHPDKYRNREREFLEQNKPFLNVIPAWLKPIMIENDLSIEEWLIGVSLFDEDGRPVSPEFEEVVDLINWAKANKKKLAS